MSPTGEYVDRLQRLKAGARGVLRSHRDQGLDESVDAFDLFTGLWWPLRKPEKNAPRRSVAWLVAKLYACCNTPHSPGKPFAAQLRLCAEPHSEAQKQLQHRLDRIVGLPIERIEPDLRWTVGHIGDKGLGIDWIILTNNLSGWDSESVRTSWAEQFLGLSKRS